MSLKSVYGSALAAHRAIWRAHPMGHDGVELVMAIEEGFGVTIADADNEEAFQPAGCREPRVCGSKPGVIGAGSLLRDAAE